MFKGQVRWCDFLSAKKLEPLGLYYRDCDLQKLAESLLRRKGPAAPTVSAIEGMLSSNLESYDEIVKFVSKALFSGPPPTNN